jgi:ADP-heptose:LPS heptosyltransferase
VWISDDARVVASTLIPEGPPVLAIGPTANWTAKMWRPEYFVELIQRLTGAGGIMPGARVAVFGRDDERPMALQVIEAIPEDRRIDLVGRIDLPTAAACLARAHFYVGNDSGLASSSTTRRGDRSAPSPAPRNPSTKYFRPTSTTATPAP